MSESARTALVELVELGRELLPQRGESFHGLMGPARSLMEAVLASEAEGPVLLVVAHERRLLPAASDVETFLRALGSSRPVLTLPSFALDPYRGLTPHFEAAAARVRSLVALAAGEPVVVIATAPACLYRTAPPRVLLQGVLELAPGVELDPEELAHRLVDRGYQHEDPIGSRGDFARRGGIIDIFPPDREEPVRLELAGDELEEIRSFDIDSQRTTGKLERVRILPAREWVLDDASKSELVTLLGEDDWTLDRVASLAAPGFVLPRSPAWRASLVDYLGDHLVLVEEPSDVVREAEHEWERLLDSYQEAEESFYGAPAELLLEPDELRTWLDRSAIAFQEMELFGEREQPGRHLSAELLPSFRGRLPDFVSEVERQLRAERQVRLFAKSEGQAHRIGELLTEAGVSVTLAGEETEADPGHPAPVRMHLGALSQSFFLSEPPMAVFTTSDLFAEPARPAARRTRKLTRFLSDFRDLKLGDFVVHTDHGIGVFSGLQRIDESEDREFVVLEYLGGDKLYVPVERLDLLEKYSSKETSRPKLDKLGGTGWERVKKRVKKSMRNMAQELLKLYAARKASPGHAFSTESPWQREFEDLFDFEETPDQLQAIEDVRRDMETESPMDRLLCGDVGYGKTEVAMRAAFKAVMDGKQVAVLVPTTVLAFQHWTTFRERFASFPARIEMLSRFRKPKEQKEVVKDLASGAVDIVIGTHRLLSKDVELKDLGLMIVDEEQRFGVTHKERLKKLRHGVDCLTLTATPIPRTLHMSLSGIRDMSVIETPPKDRMSIQTHISRLNPKVLSEAIRYELARDGQIYVVHNRVGSIYSMASYLERLVPEARFGVAHGQMKESDLERIMLRFIRHEFDVLVSTTIIENGLDIPLVNTLIVNRADRFGLSQLYQLRGRVGRSNRRAYAYLLVPEEGTLTPIARRRLAAIREFSELGAGFRIAALDLELRGAGNLLGGEQHGHMEAVGFDLYCRLLEQTVEEVSSGTVDLDARASLNLRVELRIPENYVRDINQRMSIYKRASTARELETIERLTEETRDRYGPLPEEVLQFFEYARLRVLADELKLAAIDREGKWLLFRMQPNTNVEPEEIVALTDDWPGSRADPEGDGALLRIPLEGTTAPEILSTLREILRRLG